MREFIGLFWGKRTDTGDWVEGCLLQIGEARKFDPNVPFSNCYIVPKTDADVVMRINNDRTIALDIEAYHVDPTTIGECTSIKDKNGKLIFEGHIVNGNYNEKYVVKYGRHDLICCGCCHDSHEAVGFYLKDKYGYPHSDDEAWHDLEIIGNIHDNPELKGGEQ